MSNELNPANHAEYSEIISIIERARENAFRAVNRELISMYWKIGNYVSDKIKKDGWGKSVVKDFSQYIQSQFLGIRGFSPQNIWRMKQFYETYCDNEKLSTLSREISWSNNKHPFSSVFRQTGLHRKSEKNHLAIRTRQRVPQHLVLRG